MSLRAPVLAAACVLAAAGAVAATAAEPPPSSCLIQRDKAVPIARAAGRVVYCGLDLGSRSAKLSVVSMEKGRNATIRDERACKRTLGMGALVFDSRAGTARALPPEATAALVDTIREYAEICARDGGTIVAAAATQWARDATNIGDVLAAVKTATGVRVDVLSPRQEAEYSYAAASVNTPGRLVLDAGSNSFELAWQVAGAPVASITVPYGYVRGAANDFADAPDYAAGLRAYQAHAREKIEAELAKLDPPSSLARLKELVDHGRVGREIIALGEDGAIVPLATGGALRRADGWIADQKAYDDALSAQPRPVDRSFGTTVAAPVPAAEIASFLRAIRPADLATLKGDPVRGLYGQKALVVPALVDLLMRELGASRLVVVPQESTTGHILVRTAASPALSAPSSR